MNRRHFIHATALPVAARLAGAQDKTESRDASSHMRLSQQSYTPREAIELIVQIKNESTDPVRIQGPSLLKIYDIRIFRITSSGKATEIAERRELNGNPHIPSIRRGMGGKTFPSGAESHASIPLSHYFELDEPGRYRVRVAVEVINTRTQKKTRLESEELIFVRTAE